MTQLHCDITTDKDGTIHAVSVDHQLTILPDGPAKAFNRNAKRINKDEHVRALVGELNGVRIYVQGTSIIMTTRDLYL